MTWIKRVSAGIAPVFRFSRITKATILTCSLLAMAGAAEALKIRRVKEQGLIAAPRADVIHHRGGGTAGRAGPVVLQMGSP